MKTNKIETSLVSMTIFNEPKTIGELISILEQFPKDMSFGFRNQPFQELKHIVHKKENFECVCFEEKHIKEFK